MGQIEVSKQSKKEERKRRRQLKRRKRRRAIRRFLIRLCVALPCCFALFFYMDLGNKVAEEPEDIGAVEWAGEVEVFKVLEKAGMEVVFNEEEYPESLLALLKKNPETREFVMNYPRKKDQHETITFSEEIVPGEIPLFLQWDERWGYETYGDDFLALTGCGPTCLSMVRCGLSGNGIWDPYQVACLAEEEGYYVSGAGSAWSLMTEGAELLGLSATQIGFDREQIISLLKEGTPIICVVGPGDFTEHGHFLVLKGVDDSGRILLNDPNSRLRSEKAWEFDRLIKQVKNLWAYSY